MGRVTITFYPSDRKQSKTTMQIPIYLRIRKESKKKLHFKSGKMDIGYY